MTEQNFLPVGDIAELVADAYDLIAELEGKDDETSVTSAEVRNWLAKCNHLIDRLNGNRTALYNRVLEALGTASVCWDPRPEGVFQDHEAVRAADKLMDWIDEYASMLPLVRPGSLISREEDDSQERLAASIYEISTRIGSGMIEKWSDAPEQIKETLRSTAAELLRMERDANPLTTVTVEDVLTPEEKQRFASAMSEAEQAIRDTKFTGLPPNIPMPPGFHSGGGGE